MIITIIQRATASTHIHDKSSRSHAIFTITFIQVIYILIRKFFIVFINT
jgi:hypothetical protein